jgi:serine/threonine protein phosphatase PrpC
MRRCKECKTPIQAASKCNLFIEKKGFCGIECATQWGKKAALNQREKAYRKETQQRRERLKTRTDYIKEAQQAVNRYIRIRDQRRGCISCGTTIAGQYHAGHYRTTKACPDLRFYTLQIWKQCAQCNAQLSGNIIPYRQALVALLGDSKVMAIEGQPPARTYSIDDLRRIKRIFTKKAKMRVKQ